MWKINKWFWNTFKLNLLNLKEQIAPINQNEINMETYILNKNNQCQNVEQQIENIINKYY